MANKVTPASEKHPPSTSASSPMLDVLKTHVRSKLCYHSSALTTAKVTNVQQDCFAYQIDIWTLMERRKMKKVDQPYNGENIPNEAHRNEWDFDIQRPETDFNKKKTDTHNLDQTRWTTVCLKCSGFGHYVCSTCKGDGGKPCYYCKVKALTDTGDANKKLCTHCNDTNTIQCQKCKSSGMIECKGCKGCGKFLHWYRLTVNWYTIHSVSYQTNTTIPPKMIHKAIGKKTTSTIDQKWTKTDSFDKFFQTSVANQPGNSSIKLDKLTEDFNKKHLKNAKKNCRIVKLKCEVQKLDVTEVEYEAEGFKNKEDAKMGDKFKFYTYGKGKKDQPIVYENDYPLNTCGCCVAGCAHHSKCCTIS